MARNVDDIYNFMLYICRKQRGKLVTQSEAMNALDVGQMDKFNEYWLMYGVNQTVHDAIKPFRIYHQFTSNAAGMVTYPSGVLHILGTPFSINGSTVNEITFKNEGEMAIAIKSQLRPVSLSNPIAVDTDTGFSIYPQVQQTGYMWYLRRPVKPVWGGTQVGRVLTYNSSTSTQLEWNETYINGIIASALRYVGVNISDEGVYQFAETYNKETV